MSWDEHVQAWSHVPVDDVGYFPSSMFLEMHEEALRSVIESLRFARYSGWRNYNGLWRDVLGLDSTTDKDVLDFGCGFGVEALELALAGNRVSLADIVPENIQLASRVLSLYRDRISSMKSIDLYLIFGDPPFIDCEDAKFDVFYCNGVLHHISYPRQIMERAHSLLRTDGEVRLMVYSDIGWRLATNTDPPDEVTEHPKFSKFVRHFDGTGHYSDWYSKSRIQERFGDLFDITRCEYLTENQQYLGAVLTKKD